MPVTYANTTQLFSDDFATLENWHHEGIGQIVQAPGDGMRLHCLGSKQGREGCMAFFRPDLPDGIAIEYDVTMRGHGGLMINYVAIRGLHGEDMIRDAARLAPRTGIMANYYAKKWGLQSYHVSISRFDDKGRHTGTSNWRRNPGSLLAGHGVDPVTELGRPYHIRLTKDRGHCQLFVDGAFAHALIDRDTTRYPIPDYGKFGFRLIGSDVMADVTGFRVFLTETKEKIWADHGDAQ
jgi:hypothetical protein